MDTKTLNTFGQTLTNIDLSSYNTYRIHSTTSYFIEPYSIEKLIKLIKYIKKEKVPYFIIGNGSNIIIDDKNYNGIIIKLSNLDKIEFDKSKVKAQAGVMLPILARKTIEQSLSGLEFASGIPGTLGGSIVGNAGAYGEDIMTIVETVTILDNNLKIKTISKKDIEYSYRNTQFKNNKDIIILEAKLHLRKGEKKKIEAIVAERLEKRKETQPLEYPSAGSVFRNPENNFAGKLIEEAGLKGKSIGDAQVSNKHANFIINKGNATSKDIKSLIFTIQKTIKQKNDIELVKEQEIVDWK